MEFATGTLPSGVKFTVLISAPVDVDEVAMITTLLRRCAIKAENEHCPPTSGEKS